MHQREKCAHQIQYNFWMEWNGMENKGKKECCFFSVFFLFRMFCVSKRYKYNVHLLRWKSFSVWYFWLFSSSRSSSPNSWLYDVNKRKKINLKKTFAWCTNFILVSFRYVLFIHFLFLCCRCLGFHMFWFSFSFQSLFLYFISRAVSLKWCAMYTQCIIMYLYIL